MVNFAVSFAKLALHLLFVEIAAVPVSRRGDRYLIPRDAFPAALRAGGVTHGSPPI